MKKTIYILLIIVLGCTQQVAHNESKNPLKGDWCFLDKYGNYTETYFGDSTYRIYNRYVGAAPLFSYFLKNDSLYSNVDKRKKGMTKIAGLNWLDDDHVILTTEFAQDTLQRMINPAISLRNAHPQKDSVKLLFAFYERYEDFLISRGIITAEEVENFRKEQKIPEDVKQKLQAN